MYKLIVNKYQPRTEEQIKRIEEERRYGRGGMDGLSDFDGINRVEYEKIRSLEVELTDEQFAAVKKGVMDSF